jgi:hypothetical protein
MGSPMFKRFLFELIIDGIHPFPGDYDKVFDFVLLGKKIQYRLLTFFYALTFLKIYHVTRALSLFSKYYFEVVLK